MLNSLTLPNNGLDMISKKVPVRSEITPDNSKFLESRIRRHKKKIQDLIIDVVGYTDKLLQNAEATYKVGLDLTPLEIMANFHRFNNSKQLQRYCGSFWSRAALMDVFKKSVVGLREMLGPLQKNQLNSQLSAEFANVEKELQRTKEWIEHLLARFSDVKKMLKQVEQGPVGKKSLPKSQTGQLLNELKNRCTFCGGQQANCKTCSQCKLAKYCTEECRARYKAHHDFLCTEKGAKDVLNLLVGLTTKDCDEIIAANRKIRRGQVFKGPINLPGMI